jgi:hypothetical protein
MAEPREIDAAKITRVVRYLCIEINYRVPGEVVRISGPLSDDDVRALEIGDVVLVNRTVYAAPTDEWAVKNGGG